MPAQLDLSPPPPPSPPFAGLVSAGPKTPGSWLRHLPGLRSGSWWRAALLGVWTLFNAIGVIAGSATTSPGLIAVYLGMYGVGLSVAAVASLLWERGAPERLARSADKARALNARATTNIPDALETVKRLYQDRHSHAPTDDDHVRFKVYRDQSSFDSDSRILYAERWYVEMQSMTWSFDKDGFVIETWVRLA